MQNGEYSWTAASFAQSTDTLYTLKVGPAQGKDLSTLLVLFPI